MKRPAPLAFLLALVLCMTGCVENAMLLKLKPDGSGTIVYRLYLSDPMLEMMESVEAGSGENDTPPEEALTAIRDRMTNQFGDQARLQSSREISNRAGWRGFEAIYSFDDINQIHLYGIDPMGGDPATTDNAGRVGGQYAIEFVQGEESLLRLVPEETGPAADDPGESTEIVGMPLESMRTLFAGMRMSFLIAVDGEIVETNARYRNQRHPNVIALMDVSMDKLIDDPDGARLLQSGQAANEEALAALDIPGVKMEAPGKTIEIRFR